MKQNFEPIYLAIIFGTLALIGSGSTAVPSNMDTIKKSIESIIPGSTIELDGQPEKIRGDTLSAIRRIQFNGEIRPGRVRYIVEDASGSEAEYEIGYKAWVDAWVAKRRLLPNERVSANDFQLKKVDVATGMNREAKGLIASVETDLSRMEARQTIIEGSVLIGTALSRIPDLKKGDAVKIRMFSGNLILSTMGTATEPAYIDQPAKILTNKGKKDLVGVLKKDGFVEVSL